MIINLNKKAFYINAMLFFGLNCMNAQEQITAIAPSKMNVFYRGVENPVKIVSTSNFDSITANNGGKIWPVLAGQGNKNGEFIFTAVSTGTTEIKIYAGGKVISSETFRVKPVPSPEIKLMGQFANCGTFDFSKIQLAAIGGISCGIQGFDFDLNFVVISYELTGTNEGALKIASGSGDSISKDAKTILQNADPNTKVYIDVKVKEPDGKIRNMGASIKVK